jgi:hypothetical protein
LVPRPLDEGPRPKKSGKIEAKPYMAPVLKGKSIGSDQRTVLKGELPIWRTKNQARDQGRVQLKEGFNLVQISPNWFLGNWILDPLLKWALVPWLKTMNFLSLLLTNHGKDLVILKD